jgi:phage shock protein A
MGIFGRMSTLLKANINDMISKAEDPEKILNQLILDMKDQLIEAKKQVAVAIADEKRLKKQLDNELYNASEWEKKAMMAIRAGRDDLAKEALRRKGEHDQLATEFQVQWEAQKSAADQLRESLRQLNAKIEEAKRKKNLLIARQKRAEAQKHIQETVSSLSNASAFDAFERMAGKIERMEAEAEASTELNRDLAGANLEDQFKGFERETEGDSALAALKAKMGMGSTVFEEQKQTQKQTQAAPASAGGRGTWDTDDF